MKVVLLKDVPKVGKKFDIKDVASGYALNLLIPKGLAEVATDSSVKKVELLKASQREVEKKAEDMLVKNLEAVKNHKITLHSKANEKGHLFASIHKDEIVKALKEKFGVEFSDSSVAYDSPIKEIGEHTVEIKIGDKSAKVKVEVKAEK